MFSWIFTNLQSKQVFGLVSVTVGTGCPASVGFGFPMFSNPLSVHLPRDLPQQDDTVQPRVDCIDVRSHVCHVAVDGRDGKACRRDREVVAIFRRRAFQPGWKPILSIYLASVPDADYQYQQNIAMNVVDHAVIADANPVSFSRACEFSGAGRKRIDCKRIYLGGYALAQDPRERLKRAVGCRSNLDVIGHMRYMPSRFLASSQGMLAPGSRSDFSASSASILSSRASRASRSDIGTIAAMAFFPRRMTTR
jgi:hypothetical protein